jgi:hypothetical protein
MPYDVKRKDSVLIEAAQSAERHDLAVGDAQDRAEIVGDIDIGDLAEELAARVTRAGGEIDPDEIIEHQRLRRLREAGAADREAMFGGIEDPT